MFKDEKRVLERVGEEEKELLLDNHFISMTPN